MKKYFLFLTVVFIHFLASAQTAEDSVKATVNTMFLAMRNGDTSLFNRVFVKDAILQTIINDRQGNTRIISEPLAEFASLVSTLKKDSADERIQFETIRVDGPLAIVWTPYKFYLNGSFSHCGVNSFQLVRIKSEWKINYIIDTRRKNACLF